MIGEITETRWGLYLPGNRGVRMRSGLLKQAVVI